MDYKEKRAEIIKRNFSGVGLLIITVLGLFGIFIMFISGVFAVSSFEELYDCIYYSGFEIIIGLFCNCFGLFTVIPKDFNSYGDV